ncbi:MAG: glycosyltransferase [Burkholderiaceae bacterium]
MKFLIYSLNFSPEPTGVGKYCGELAYWLAERGHEIQVVTAQPYYPEWRVAEGFSAWRYRRERIEVGAGRLDILRCPLWVPRRPRTLTRVLHLLSFAISSVIGLAAVVRSRPDLMLVSMPTILIAPQAWLMSRLMRVPAWLHVQDFEVRAALELNLIEATAR